jgi:glycosyltransferase involved in cell wall biosynthesis
LKLIPKNLGKHLPPSLKLPLKLLTARLSGKAAVEPIGSSVDSHSSSQLQVLVVDDHLPAPDRDAGGARMFLILKSLAKLGRTVFVSMSDQRSPETEDALKCVGIETVHWSHYKQLLKDGNFDVAILSRPDVASAFLPAIRKFSPTTRIIFDTVDIVFKRLEREFCLSGERSVAIAARRYAKLEGRLAHECDQVWCVTNEDKLTLAERAPEASFMIIPTIHPLKQRGKSFAEREGLVFIGNYLHRPNTDAIHYFMREIYPIIKEAIPGLRVFVVGGHAPPDFQKYVSESVTVTGHVPDVDEIFQSCRAFIAPLRYGSGIKGKIGQALSYGLPAITTSIGAEGMGIEDGRDVLIADEPLMFAQAVTRVYADPRLWQKLSDNGYAHVARNFTPEVVEARIHLAIDSLLVGSARVLARS